MQPNSSETKSRRKYGRASASGVHHVAIQNFKDGSKRYLVVVTTDGVKKSKSFPYTPEGLAAASELAEHWQQDITFEPERTHQKRKRRDMSYEHPEREETKAPLRLAPAELPTGTWRVDNGDTYLTLRPGIEAIVSAQDVPRVSQHRWILHPNSMGSWYAQTNINGKTVYMHRFVTNAPYQSQVDHRNHDTLDNRRENLLVTTVEHNNSNRNGAYVSSRTGIRGVSIHNPGKRGAMYVFRCHIKRCKVAKYFPYSDEGLVEAKAYAEAHYAAIKEQAF